jgi:UDP-3-O-[3-hydroxymyristoyl] glucosamine N-acyltransferase
VKCISESKAGVIFCKKDIGALIVTNGARHPYQTLILLDNPRHAFMHVMNQLYQETNPEKRTEISSNAIVSENSSIGRNCRIGNFTVIEDNCTIGDNVTIHDRVSLLKNSSIGNNCIIQPGAVIGADGFAFERYEKTMKLERFPHIGGTRIGDNVEISSNCSIARGSINDTVIGHGTKLDALVHVAHNVEIGRNCILTAGAIIGGSTIVGDTTWLGLNCTLKNKIKIGNKVIVGSGANVINDIPAGDIVAGVPAKSIRNKVTCRKLFMMAGQGT